MLKLSSDGTFNFEMLRVLGASRYAASDVGEVLDMAEKVAPGDFASWTQAYRGLAARVEKEAQRDGATAVTIRDSMFRAANYWRAADFFIHEDIHDPRICEFWDAQTRCFGEAIARLPIPGERFEVETSDFTILATFFRASTDDAPRPTLLMCNGFDGGQEEMAHLNGFSALERGFNVVAFEGPGQPAVRRNQDVGFGSAEWEKVVTPLIDRVLTLPTVDPERIGLLGNSYGGYLAPRAAAFEHRLAAVICIDGVFDAYEGFASSLTDELRALLDKEDRDTFNAAVPAAIKDNTNLRWMVQQGIWAFKVETAYDVFHGLKGQTLEGITDRIECPVFVGCAQHDRFFEGQPQQMAKALGDRATFYAFEDDQSAGQHCQVGAAVVLNQASLDWFAGVVGAKGDVTTRSAIPAMAE